MAPSHSDLQLSSSTLAGRESGQGKAQEVEDTSLHPSCSLLHGYLESQLKIMIIATIY